MAILNSVVTITFTVIFFIVTIISRHYCRQFLTNQIIFVLQATSDQMRLLEFQKRLQNSYKKQFLNLSVTDTLYQLIYIGYKSEADNLRKEFSVPDTRFWWVKIQALAAAGDWDELETFSKSKKSPIGYEV